MNNCLNCKFEPDWSEPTTGEYPRMSGDCKWNLTYKLQVLPKVYRIHREFITRYSDDSGGYFNCQAHEPKA